MSRLLHFLPALILMLALAPAVAVSAADEPGSHELAADNPASSLTLADVEDSFRQLQQLVTDLKSSGDLSPAGAEQLELLMGGLLGSLSYRISELASEPWDEEEYGTGGAPGDPITYYSEVLPSRQITLFTNPDSATTPDAKLAGELSLWIDDAGNAFVSGAADDASAMRQLSLKQGWEGDFDELNSQILKLLAEFMEQHAEEAPPSEPGVAPPGTAL